MKKIRRRLCPGARLTALAEQVGVNRKTVRLDALELAEASSITPGVSPGWLDLEATGRGPNADSLELRCVGVRAYFGSPVS